MSVYVRPIPCTDTARPPGARPLAGSAHVWFDRAELLARARPGRVVAAETLSDETARRLSAPRAALCGLSLERPRLMGIVNVTPDSFSDGGQFFARDTAIAHGRQMAQAGADILDIGGESTRPGAAPVTHQQERDRVVPVIEALADAGAPISIDTRNAAVARAALAAGAGLVNDVSAFTHDSGMAAFVAAAGVPACLMHIQGSPETMQRDPRYDDVLLDVYDYLAARVAAAAAAGVPRARLIVDPGIGFGKTVAHNLALIRGLSIFHGLGCAVLLGASRKRFIGTLAEEPQADRRVPGSLAVALAGMGQGAQIIRVHDLAETRQALSLWQALANDDEGQQP
ncbi:dihydropteroate synthase [Rhodobacteraceae bacterium WD3A24]|nr:dihydropteroate synthase [Rhodobacteraceae bacterium WD3A24]